KLHLLLQSFDNHQIVLPETKILRLIERLKSARSIEQVPVAIERNDRSYVWALKALARCGSDWAFSLIHEEFLRMFLGQPFDYAVGEIDELNADNYWTGSFGLHFCNLVHALGLTNGREAGDYLLRLFEWSRADAHSSVLWAMRERSRRME